MKIKVDNEEVLNLSETQKKVIQNDIHEDIFNDDMKRRVRYILMHKYEECLKRLKKEWEPKLKERVPSFPSNDEEFAELIFAQPDYKSKKHRHE